MDEFKKLMGRNLIEKWDVVPNADWDILENLYQKHINNEQKKEKIPKKIHQIWLGSNIPPFFEKLSLKIKNNHPDWEYKLWTDTEISNIPLINQKLYNSLKNFGSKSDVVRYEILYREGGVYMDTDFEMVKSFDELLYLDFFTGVGHSTEPMVFNGLFGSVKNSNLLKNIIFNLREKFNSDNNIINSDPMYSTGPYFFSKIFFDYINNFENKNEKIVVLPTPYFYPLPATERFKIRNRFDELKNFIYSFNTDKTICIHLWNNSWI